MNDSLFATTLISIVLLVTSVNATPANAQEPEGSPPAGTTEIDAKAEGVVFDAKKLASTVGILSLVYSVEYEEIPLTEVLRAFAERSGVEFQHTINADILVTFKTSASFGKMLGDLLASVDCEYAILPNGRIEVRNKPDDANPAEKPEPTIISGQQEDSTPAASDNLHPDNPFNLPSPTSSGPVFNPISAHNTGCFLAPIVAIV